MQSTQEKRKVHYGWLILMSCCLIQGAALGLVNNCAGIFFVPVSAELGVSTGDLSLYLTFQCAISCLGMLLAKKMLMRVPLKILMIVAACFIGIPLFLMGGGKRVWHWYVSGALQGVGLTYLCYFIPSILLPNWFRKKLGFAVGLSAAFAGATGALMSWVLAWIIRNISWRVAYVISGVVFFLMTVPVSLFVVRMTPEEMGCRPYGDALEEMGNVEARQDLSEKQNPSGLHILMMILVAVLAKAVCGLNAHLPTFGTSVPLVIADAAILTTFCMIGNMLLKLLFGVLDDKINVQKTSYLVLLTIGAGILMMYSRNQIAMCVGAFLFGAAAMFSSVQTPILVQSIWSKERYADMIVVVNMSSALFYSLSISLFGYLYDWSGNYDLSFRIILAMLVVEGLFIYELFHRKRKA